MILVSVEFLSTTQQLSHIAQLLGDITVLQGYWLKKCKKKKKDFLNCQPFRYLNEQLAVQLESKGKMWVEVTDFWCVIENYSLQHTERLSILPDDEAASFSEGLHSASY